jgi:ATP-dependent Clp protease adapter protein ClpS
MGMFSDFTISSLHQTTSKNGINVDSGLLFYTGKYKGRVPDGVMSESKESEQSSELFEVKLIDNDHNTYQEVINVSMIALGITADEAYGIAWEVDHLGSCIVAYAPKHEAEHIARIIRSIGIEVIVQPRSIASV